MSEGIQKTILALNIIVSIILIVMLAIILDIVRRTLINQKLTIPLLPIGPIPPPLVPITPGPKQQQT